MGVKKKNDLGKAESALLGRKEGRKEIVMQSRVGDCVNASFDRRHFFLADLVGRD